MIVRIKCHSLIDEGFESSANCFDRRGIKHSRALNPHRFFAPKSTVIPVTVTSKGFNQPMMNSCPCSEILRLCALLFPARRVSPSTTRSPSLSLCNGCPESVLTCFCSCVSFLCVCVFSSLQIHIDIPRTNPLIPLFQQASVQEVRRPHHSVHSP